MNTMITHILKPFKSKQYIYSLLIDVGYFAILFVSLSVFGAWITKLGERMIGGMDVNQLQQYLLNAPVEQVEAFSVGLKQFMSAFFLGGLVLLLLLLFLFSLSRAYMWYNIKGKKLSKKNYWRWNSLNLALIIPTFLYSLIFIFIKFLLVNRAWTHESSNFFFVINNVVNITGLVIYLVFLFLVYYSFTEKYKVFTSIGHAFHILKKKFKNFVAVIGISLLFLVLIAVLLLFLRNVMTPTVLSFSNVVLTVLFVAWLRLYVVEKLTSHS